MPKQHCTKARATILPTRKEEVNICAKLKEIFIQWLLLHYSRLCIQYTYISFLCFHYLPLASNRESERARVNEWCHWLWCSIENRGTLIQTMCLCVYLHNARVHSIAVSHKTSMCVHVFIDAYFPVFLSFSHSCSVREDKY